MAKVQIIMPVTLDGFLPDKNEILMEWLRTDRNGFHYWEERATFNMYPHYGMLDLMDAKERRDNNCTFFMKVQDEKSVDMLVEYFSSDSQMNWSFTCFQYHIKVEKT